MQAKEITRHKLLRKELPVSVFPFSTFFDAKRGFWGVRNSI